MGSRPEVPWMAVRQWVRYVARELARPSKHGAHISAYAYTNEHEFFAVLAEYFFTSPELVETSGSRPCTPCCGTCFTKTRSRCSP